jgi:hypothetical protein
VVRNTLKRASAVLILLSPVLAAAQNQGVQASTAAAAATPSRPADSGASRRAARRALDAKQKAALDAVRADATLTHEQRQSKIDAIVEDFRVQREKIMGRRYRRSRYPRSPALTALNARQRAALDAVRADKSLTPDQQRSKIVAIVKDFEGQREKLTGVRTPRRKYPDTPAFAAINAGQKAALDAIRADGTLTPEQRQGKVDATAKDYRAKRAALLKSVSPSGKSAATNTPAAHP